MFVSVGIRPAVHRDLQRIMDATPEAERSRLKYCAHLMVRWLKFNPEQIGTQPTSRPTRRLVHGPLMMFYEVRHADDRYAEIVGVSINHDWIP